MQPKMTGTCAVALAWMTLVAAQGRPPQRPSPPAQAPQVQDVTLTGCVVDGVTPGIHLLANAVERPGSNEKVRTFRLIGGGEDIDFTQHLNHEVQATGVAELKTPPTPPAGGQINEKDLPTFTVKTLDSLVDRCVGQ